MNKQLNIMKKLNELRDRIEAFIIWLAKELKETSINCPKETRW
jgi:hypothetical protein